MAKESEFRAYPWIDAQLRAHEWDTRNPNTTPDGQVWTQNEALAHPEIKRTLGAQRPESVIKVDANTLAIVEAKNGQHLLATALSEARSYCEDINRGTSTLSAVIAIGVAGSEGSGFSVASELLIDGQWCEILEGEEACRRLLSPKEMKRIIAKGIPQVIPTFLGVNEAVSLALEINNLLHSAKVEKEKRALFVALMILALHQDPTLSFNANAQVFINDINSRASQPFMSLGRQALWDSVAITYSQENLNERALGLSRVLDLLKEADIASAAQHHDILGNFFESFLKYGNTSKELGIVLTPRHICRFAADAVAVNSSDIVLDVAAGTGGFLVAAYNRVKTRSTLDAARTFAAHNIYGCEDSGPVAALAFINMYLRGDGKHNLKNDSCFNWDLVDGDPKAIFSARKSGPHSSAVATKVLMNPPFSLRNGVQKEVDFVDHGLRQLQKNGVLFAILPASIMYDRETQIWRKQLLTSHTLLSVVSFPVDLFYPVSTETLGVFIRAWTKHDVSEPVLWARVANDGFVKRKRFRVEHSSGASTKALSNLSSSLKNWICDGTQIHSSPGSLEFRTLSATEFVPHAHLGTPSLEQNAFDDSAMSVVKNILIEQWARPK